MKTRLILILLYLLPLSGLCVAPQPHHKLGWKSDPQHAKHVGRQFVHHAAFATPIKPNTDLGALLPPVYDQGNEGSCVANASLAAFESQWFRQHGAFFGGSRQGLYRDLLIHDGSFPRDNGSYTATAVWVLINKGVGLELSYPYYAGYWAKAPPAKYLAEAATYRLVRSYDVDNTDHVSIRKALSAGFPVVFGGSIYQSLEDLTARDYFNAPAKGKSLGGHERVIIGHDDNLTHTSPSGRTIKGFYWVRNSWGTGWGKGGCCWEPMSEIENPQRNGDCAVLEVTK